MPSRVLGRHVERLAESGDLVDLGKLRCQLVAVALGHAAGDHQAGAVATLVVEREDRVDRLATGLVDERAGVHHDEVGERGVVGRFHAVREQRADQLVGIDVVLRAAERLDVEPLGHGHPRYPRHLPPGPIPAHPPESMSETPDTVGSLIAVGRGRHRHHWWARRNPGRGQRNDTSVPLLEHVT